GGRYITEQTNRLKVGSALGRSGMDKARNGETMKLGAFFHPTGNHVAAWLHPDAQIDAGTNFRHYAEITQTAERGKFDLMFVADAVATRDGKLEALSRWPQYMAYFVLAETRPDSRCWLFDPCGTCHPFSSSHQFLLCERERVKKGLHRGLAEAPAALVRPLLVVVDEPGIEIGLQFLNRAIDLFTERH